MTKTLCAVMTALVLSAGIACAQTPAPGSNRQQAAAPQQYQPKGAQKGQPAGTGKHSETGSYAPGGTTSNTPMNDGR